MFFKTKKVYTVETLGAEVLRRKSEPIAKVDDEIRALAAWMIEVLDKFEGIGLAAPQIGVNKRLVVFHLSMESMDEAPSPGELLLLPRMPLAVVNPEIVSCGKPTGVCDEGCLSIPDIFAPVERPLNCRFKAQTLDGDTIDVECGGMLARCIQHELDHLDGVLYIDHLKPADRAEIEKSLARLEKFGQKHDFIRKIRA